MHATITNQTVASTFTFPINLHTHDAPKNVASHARAYDTQNTACTYCCSKKCQFTWITKMLHKSNNTPNCCMQCPEKMPPKNVVCNVLICCNTYLTPSKYCMHKMLLRASVMMPKHIVCTYETPKQFMHPKMLH